MRNSTEIVDNVCIHNNESNADNVCIHNNESNTDNVCIHNNESKADHVCIHNNESNARLIIMTWRNNHTITSKISSDYHGSHSIRCGDVQQNTDVNIVYIFLSMITTEIISSGAKKKMWTFRHKLYSHEYLTCVLPF